MVVFPSLAQLILRTKETFTDVYEGYTRFCRKILVRLSSLTYLCMQASVAKLETLVSVSTDKLELKVYGFNDKLPALLSKILKTTKSFMPISDRFMVCLDIHPCYPLYVWFKFHIDKNTLLVLGLFMTGTLNRLLKKIWSES